MRTQLAGLAICFIFAACATAKTAPPEGEAASAQVCKMECSCTGCSNEEAASCDADFDALEAKAAESDCGAELQSLVGCVTESAECNDGSFDTYCDSQEDKLTECLKDESPTCAHVADGLCDEPEGTGLCAEGTDVLDCAVGGCAYEFDGICDEPEGTGYCADGTDPSDCAVESCPYTNDGTCDEPEGTGLCANGTDVSDCSGGSTCPYTNDGECDEPEGTGICAEGTDVNDCLGGGACSSCYDWAFGGSSADLCPGSAAIYNDLYDCICNAACADACFDGCNGGTLDATCQSCVNTSCSSQLAACENDI